MIDRTGSCVSNPLEKMRTSFLSSLQTMLSLARLSVVTTQTHSTHASMLKERGSSIEGAFSLLCALLGGGDDILLDGHNQHNAGYARQ